MLAKNYCFLRKMYICIYFLVMKKILFLYFGVLLCTPTYAQTYEQLYEKGVFYYKENNFREALVHFEQMKKVAEKEVGKKDDKYHNACVVLASLHAKMTNYVASEAQYQELGELKTQKYGKESKEYALVCNKLAFDVYFPQEAYRKAIPLLEIVKNIQEKTSGNASADYADACTSLAVVYLKATEYTFSETFLLKAKNIYQTIYGKKSTQYAYVCEQLVILYEKQGKRVMARALLKEVQEARK